MCIISSHDYNRLSVGGSSTLHYILKVAQEIPIKHWVCNWWLVLKTGSCSSASQRHLPVSGRKNCSDKKDLFCNVIILKRFDMHVFMVLDELWMHKHLSTINGHLDFTQMPFNLSIHLFFVWLSELGTAIHWKNDHNTQSKEMFRSAAPFAWNQL